MFKVGDRIKLVNVHSNGSSHGINIGQVVTVTEIRGESDIRIDAGSSSWSHNPKSFILAAGRRNADYVKKYAFLERDGQSLASPSLYSKNELVERNPAKEGIEVVDISTAKRFLFKIKKSISLEPVTKKGA